MTPARALGSAALLLLGAGCERTVTPADCDQVAAGMLRVWSAEVQASVEKSKQNVPADRAKEVIRAEGEKMKADWAAECKKELAGRRADPKELECLLKATSYADLGRCGEAR